MPLTVSFVHEETPKTQIVRRIDATLKRLRISEILARMSEQRDADLEVRETHVLGP